MWSSRPLASRAHCRVQEHPIRQASAGSTLSVGENSLWFLDALVNVNFADRDGESIINTDVDGGFSTSTRPGTLAQWRPLLDVWLNFYYDTRTIESGDADGSAIDWKLQAVAGGRKIAAIEP